MESDDLLAGNVQRLQFLRKKTGIDLGVSGAVALADRGSVRCLIFLKTLYVLRGSTGRLACRGRSPLTENVNHTTCQAGR